MVDWWMGGGVLVLVIASGFALTARTRTPSHLVTPSPVAGWHEALATMPRGSRLHASEADDILADTETAAVSTDALPSLIIDFDLDLGTPFSQAPSADARGEAGVASAPSSGSDDRE